MGGLKSQNEQFNLIYKYIYVWYVEASRIAFHQL